MWDVQLYVATTICHLVYIGGTTNLYFTYRVPLDGEKSQLSNASCIMVWHGVAAEIWPNTFSQKVVLLFALYLGIC